VQAPIFLKNPWIPPNNYLFYSTFREPAGLGIIEIRFLP
jgi:hypothetical protein